MKPLMNIAPVFGALLLTCASPCVAAVNTVGGTAAGADLTTGTDNTILGTEAGVAVTTGTDNTLLGYESGKGVTGSHNIILGEDPSSAITTGSSNILVGNSLTEVTDTTSSQLDIGDTLYGTLGGSGTITAANNFTALGTISGNLFSGSGASLTSLNGSNISSGTVAAARLPAGTVITSTASPAQGDILYYNGSNWVDLAAGTSGYFLETQGTGADPEWAVVSSGSGTVNSGTQYQIGYYASTGTAISGSSAITTDSGGDLDVSGNINISTATDSLEIGGNPVVALPDGDTTSIAVGESALASQSVSGGEGNIALGNLALTATTTGFWNTAVGLQALEYSTEGEANTAIGVYAMIGTSADPLVGEGNIAIGPYALNSLEGNAGANTAMGQGAGGSVTTGNYNTLIGFTAGSYVTGDDTTAVGAYALYNTTGSPNDALGFDAGEYITSGGANVALGYGAMQGISATPVTGNANTGVGNSALYDLRGAASDNTAVGYGALGTVTSGSGNTAVGFEAGITASSGTDDIFIGNDTEPGAGTDTNEIVIGQGVTGGGSNTVNINNVITVTGAGTPSTSVLNLVGTYPEIGGTPMIFSGGQLQSGGSTTLSYCPYKGNMKTTASQGIYAIPSGCLTATITSMYVGGTASQSLSAGTLYYIYLWDDSGTWVLDAETTGHTTNTTTGVEQESGDATKTLVGMVYPQSGPVLTDSATARLVATWDNRTNKGLTNAFTTLRSTTSTSNVEIDSEVRGYFLTWGDTFFVSYSGSGAASGVIYSFASLDASGAELTNSVITANNSANATLLAGSAPYSTTEGEHYVTIIGHANAGNTSYWYQGGGTGLSWMGMI